MSRVQSGKLRARSLAGGYGNRWHEIGREDGGLLISDEPRAQLGGLWPTGSTVALG